MENNDNALSGMKILMVDDNPGNLDILMDMLKGEGYQISVATSGEMALKAVDHQLPDLILLDVMMPGIDGFETCEKFKNDPVTKSIPIIFLSAKTDSTDIVKGFQVGGLDYVIKPFNQEEVLVRIRTQLLLTQTLNKNEYLVKNLKEAIQNMESAQQESLAKSKFLGRMSHELRTPLNAIIGLSQVLSMKKINPLDEENRRSVDDITTAGKHLLNLVCQVLEMNRLDSEETHWDFEKTSLVPIINEEVAGMGGLAEGQGVDVINSIDKDCEIFVNGDSDKIKKVFSNVLDNAIKYNKNGGEVTLNLTQEDPKKVCIAIRDTGDGIPEDKYEKIFEPLYRLENHVENCIDGVGVGLAVVKKFMTIMNGRVYVESKLGIESCFTLEFERWNGEDSS